MSHMATAPQPARGAATYPSHNTFPSPSLFPAGASVLGTPTAAEAQVADRYRQAVGESARAKLGWDIGAVSLGMGLCGSAAGMLHQPRDAWTLAGGVIGYAWGQRAWRKTGE